MEEVNERVSDDIRILNEEKYERLLQMLCSKDEENHKMAQLILTQLDIEKSITYIWELARKGWSITNKMVNLRTKAGRKFRDDCELFGLTSSDETDFAQFLNRKGWLTPERYQELIPEIKNRISRANSNPFYNFHITIKEKYKELDPDDTLISIDKL